MRTRRTDHGQRQNRIDYEVFATIPGGLPKGTGRAILKKRKQQARDRQRGSVKKHVKAREQGQCKAYGISPICARVGIDRHEIIPLGVGGKVTPENCVFTCRPDHDAAHGEPFKGRRLEWDWTGKAEELPPNAEEPGHVWAVWRG